MTKGKLRHPRALFQISKVLWHLDIFRRSFRDLSGHACMAESCIFCALKELFSQLQFSQESALPPDALRRALGESFFDQQKFQLGFMDDAAECFENILQRIHMHIAHGEAEDMCNARHCIPHQKFAMTLVEQSVCGACGATSEPLPFTQMVHYVSASALTAQARQNTQGPTDMFGQLLRKAGGMGDIRECPSACGAKIQICRTLMNRPEIVSIGVVWDSERPNLEHIMDVFATVGTTLRLSDVFHSVVDTRWGATNTHQLVGVVTYYGKHYSTFFFHTKLRVWIYFDDATVREIGPRWDQVVEKCRRGRYQPLLLLYANPGGTPVCTETAPKTITPLHADRTPSMKPPLSQPIIRRSITPSPEKPNINNMRRAITPNPDAPLYNQQRPLRPQNDYQNLAVIQDNIHAVQNSGMNGDQEPNYISRKTVENVLSAQNAKKHLQVHRSLSAGSSSIASDGLNVPDHLNIPRRRDSGNWSGDRNSASSSSSTTMENPYLYLVGKIQHRNSGSVPGSPTRVKPGEHSSVSSGIYDAGYDSYSLSSTDSLPIQQGLKHNLQLAQIPEVRDHSRNGVGDDCEKLCVEADQLLDKSRQTEDAHDLETALVLCNAAASKARAAMDAPYNNPQTMTFARMKHNTCIMRARSLHRRMLQEKGMIEGNLDIRHTREGSSGSGRHSRQNSRDKGNHSRQNSKELLVAPTPVVEKAPTPSKNIEIYATLPKKKGGMFKKLSATNVIEDEEYMLYDRPPRESRSIFSRSKTKDEEKEKVVREKRSRSEDRSKVLSDLSLSASEMFKKDKKEEKEDKKDGKTGKKQHKIRRKLLMGGLIKRKNRSMPDLTEGNTEVSKVVDPVSTTVDDSSVGLKGTEKTATMCGYLSEGHLEFAGSPTGCNTNPNLERSKLMRKSFHSSAGKILTAAKVPPPPPLRTTSQLSGSKLHDEVNQTNKLTQYHDYYYHNNQNQNYNQNQNHTTEPQSLPYMPSYNGYNPANNYPQRGGPQYYNESTLYDTVNQNPCNNMIITKADVHQEQSPMKSDSYNTPIDSGVDEVDCVMPSVSLELPPYPSPLNSVSHSRQPSEDFPPPPPPLDLSALEEHLQGVDTGKSTPEPLAAPAPSTFLLQLQQKRKQILTEETEFKHEKVESTERSSGDVWLKELQAKQAVLRLKRNQSEAAQKSNGSLNGSCQSLLSNDSDNSKAASVKDLASRFEQIRLPSKQADASIKRTPSTNSISNDDQMNAITSDQIQQEIREVEMLNAVVAQTFTASSNELGDSSDSDSKQRPKRTKKKSVSFCDQVILVATAEEQEDDSYIPNPILERVLRSAFNKPETEAIEQEIRSLREAELRKENAAKEQITNLNPSVEDKIDSIIMQNAVATPSMPSPPISFVRTDASGKLMQVNNAENNPGFQRQGSKELLCPTQPMYNKVPPNLQYGSSPNQSILPNKFPQPGPATHQARIQNLAQSRQIPQNGAITSNPQNSYHANQNHSSSYQQIPSTQNQQSPYQLIPSSQNQQSSYQQIPSNPNQQNIPSTQNQQSPYQPIPSSQNQQSPYQPIPSNQHSPYQQIPSSQNQQSSYQQNPSMQNQQSSYQQISSAQSQQNSYQQVPSSQNMQSSYQPVPSSQNQQSSYQQIPSNASHLHSNHLQTNQMRQSPSGFHYQQSEYNQNGNGPINGYHNGYPNNGPQSNNNSAVNGYPNHPTTYPQNGNITSPGVQTNYPSHHAGYNSSSPSYTAQSVQNYPENAQNMQQYRQHNQQTNQSAPVYQHPPPPGSNFNGQYHPNYVQKAMTRHPNNHPQTVLNGAQKSSPQGVYQRVPENANHSVYQRLPHHETSPQNGSVYQKLPDHPQNQSPYQRVPQPHDTQIPANSPYQRVPPPHPDNVPNSLYQTVPQKQFDPMYPQNQSNKLPYQQISKSMLAAQKKSVHFEPGTKGGAESPSPPKNGLTNGNVPQNENVLKTVPCNLCRKKQVLPPLTYCSDCDFYMSRFRPRH
ncbi:uncharacterized protein LOC123298602 [Chrysoperla carnea]|uniref:uncharacterized protein LOC123298602 n=1 Tax=Chrysoperla carnea TaxID=189513 RepID=UPI001D07F013|nr:uncharacterized protein LOC123298602 [Chrysoperla carnea]